MKIKFSFENGESGAFTLSIFGEGDFEAIHAVTSVCSLLPEFSEQDGRNIVKAVFDRVDKDEFLEFALTHILAKREKNCPPKENDPFGMLFIGGEVMGELK